MVANELDLDVLRKAQAGSITDRSKLVNGHVVKLGVVLDACHFTLKSFAGVVVLGEVVALPDSCSLLVVDGAHLVVAGGLGLLEVGLLDELLDKEE